MPGKGSVRDYEKIRANLGAYVHWQDHLAFSASDGTDPRSNGKKYEIVFNGRRQEMVIA
jgi:hypothetical protein